MLLLELLRFSSTVVLSMTLSTSSLSTMATRRTKPELSLHFVRGRKNPLKEG